MLRTTHLLKFVIILFFLNLSHASSVRAKVVTVRKDGSGNFLNVTNAVLAAASNDSIEVGPGTYFEGAAVRIMLPLTLYSRDGAATTILHGANTHGLLHLQSTSIVVSGLTLANGNNSQGGGAAFLDSNAEGLFEGCTFRNNNGAAGGALVGGASLTVRQCKFEDNTAFLAGSAILANATTWDIDSCVFVGNASNTRGTIWSTTAGELRNNTFVNNSSLDTIGIGGIVTLSGNTNITHNIFAGNTATAAIAYESTFGTHARSCNIFWDNSGCHVLGDTLKADELIVDPLFCDAADGDYSISFFSPAAPTNNACAVLIGALPASCSNQLLRIPKAISVRQDSTGDVATLAAALEMAVPGDTILVGPGVYAEDSVMTINFSLTLLAEGNNHSAILSGQSSHRILEINQAAVTIRGFMFINGADDGSDATGGALRVSLGRSSRVEGCMFVGNTSTEGAGAIYVTSCWGRSDLFPVKLEIINCRFVNNQSVNGNGAVTVFTNAAASIDSCSFEGNSSTNGSLKGGAIGGGEFASINVQKCLFTRNTAFAGALSLIKCTGAIKNNTFVDNTSAASPNNSGTVFITNNGGVPPPSLTYNIIATDFSGFGFYNTQLATTDSCNLYWNNARGAVGGPNQTGGLSVDPLFCSDFTGDYSIDLASPAAPNQSACGLLIGAFPIGCDVLSATGPSTPPRKSALYANVPNPFNPMTTIHFDLARDGYVSLRVFDVFGRRVRTLLAAKMIAGRHQMVWDGLDDARHGVSSGIYFYRLVAPGFGATRKMVVLR